MLHEFYRPYQEDLAELLQRHGYAPMAWDTARKGDFRCPAAYRHWRHLRADSAAAGGRGKRSGKPKRAPR